MKILCTGSLGFFMSNFIRKAIYEKLPHQFVSIDSVTTNHTKTMYVNKYHTFHVADVRDKHIIDMLFQFEKPDIVIHGAEENNNENDMISSNISGTQNILESCIKHNVSRILYLSNDSAELTPHKSLYHISKSTGEELVKLSAKQSNLSYNIIRLSNNYGPRQSLNHFIPNVIKHLINDDQVNLNGIGRFENDWTHVFDHCYGLMTVLNSGEANKTYNISAKQELSYLEVAYKICNILEKNTNLIIDSGNDQPATYSMLNTDEIKSIGWSPDIKFKDGLVNSVLWFTNNKWSLKEAI